MIRAPALLAILALSTCSGAPAAETIWWVRGDDRCPPGATLEVDYWRTSAICSRGTRPHGLAVISEARGTFAVGAHRDGERVGIWRTYRYPHEEMQARFEAHRDGRLQSFEPDAAHLEEERSFEGEPP